MHESESEDTQSYLNLSDPMDCSLLGFSVHGIFQARVLEWGVIAFSEVQSRSQPTNVKYRLKEANHSRYSLLLLLSRFSHVQICVTR